MRFGRALGSGEYASNESRPDLAKSARTHSGIGPLTRNRLGHSIGQGRDETCRILCRESECAGADIALPERNHNGGICWVGRDPHAANGAPGVVKPHSIAIDVALHRHLSIITSATMFRYWDFTG
jgi:hypothetical protein